MKEVHVRKHKNPDHGYYVVWGGSKIQRLTNRQAIWVQMLIESAYAQGRYEAIEYAQCRFEKLYKMLTGEDMHSMCG